jgi:hypothetical protein
VVLLTPYLFTPSAARREIAAGQPGAYMLGHDDGGFVPGYVGRSDRCVRERLASHELLGEFDYFAVRRARDATEAFQLECELWHYFQQVGPRLRNVIHPAAPRMSGLVCPYCYFATHVQPLLRAA